MKSADLPEYIEAPPDAPADAWLRRGARLIPLRRCCGGDRARAVAPKDLLDAASAARADEAARERAQIAWALANLSGNPLLIALRRHDFERAVMVKTLSSIAAAHDRAERDRVATATN